MNIDPTEAYMLWSARAIAVARSLPEEERGNMPTDSLAFDKLFSALPVNERREGLKRIVRELREERKAANRAARAALRRRKK